MGLLNLGSLLSGNTPAADAITIIKCSRHVIRPSAVESVSDVYTPFTPGAKSKVVIETIGGKHHEEEFDTLELAEAYREQVLELAFG